jgi:hypothetical protein
MQLYNRINKYILEKYPIAWNTNVFWMINVGLLLHIVFYALAYLTTNLNLIKSYNYTNHFFSSSIVLFYAIIVLVITILWLLKLYKNNPLKSFYKVSSSYLFIVFFHLAIPIFLLSTVYLTFNKGVHNKTNNLLNLTALKQEKEILNRAYPFMLAELKDYEFNNKAYPAPFPLSNLIGQNINNMDYNDVVDADVNYTRKETKYYNHTLDKTKPYIIIDGDYYQFGDVKCINTKCNTVCKVDSFIDVSKVAELKKHSVANFSELFINESLTDTTEYSYKKNIAPFVHDTYFSKNKERIKLLLDSVQMICKKYNTINNIDANQFATISVNELKVIGEEFREKVIIDSYRYENVNVKNIKNYLDKSALQNIFENYTIAINARFTLYSLWPFFFFAVAIAYLLLMGKFSAGLNILLSAVMGGVVIIIFSILTVLLLIGNNNDKDNTILGLMILYTSILIIIGIAAIKSSNFSKWWTDKFALITYISIPVLFFSVLGICYPGSTKKVNECGVTEYIQPWLTPQPWHFAVVALLVLIPSFIYIKKWIAKPE